MRVALNYIRCIHRSRSEIWTQKVLCGGILGYGCCGMIG